MFGRLADCFIFLLFCFQSTEVFSFEIVRDGSSTLLIYKGSDFVKTREETYFNDDWLVKDPLYRPSCFLHSPELALPYEASFDVVIHYEAYVRDFIEEVSDLSQLDVARFDIGYEDMKGDPHRKSYYLSVADLGEIEWLAKGSDFVRVRAHTSGIQSIHMQSVRVPAASRNVRVKMCAIGAQAKIRVHRIEVKISQASQFLEASAKSDSALGCFDTGAFLTNCRFDETVLDETGLVEMQYQLALDYDCRGHDIELVLKSDSVSKRILPQKGEQVVEVLGRGLKLLDLNPRKTRSATFDRSCRLKINKLVKNISDHQKEEWAKTKAALEEAISNSKVSAQAFVDLSLLAQIVDAITVALEFANKLKTLKLKGLVDLDLSIDKLLSKQQIASMKALLETKNIIEESDSQYDRFKKLEAEARQKLRELECLTNE